jgi:redox-sensitive bicupin YhaK (pirin superfamily)
MLQIWIIPKTRGGEPGYEEKRFTDADKRGRLRVVASPDGRDGSVTIRADAAIHAALIDGAERAVFDVPAGRRVYVHVARGAVTVNGEALAAGDGARIADTASVTLENGKAAEVLLFDLA